MSFETVFGRKGKMEPEWIHQWLLPWFFLNRVLFFPLDLTISHGERDACLPKRDWNLKQRYESTTHWLPGLIFTRRNSYTKNIMAWIIFSRGCIKILQFLQKRPPYLVRKSCWLVACYELWLDGAKCLKIGLEKFQSDGFFMCALGCAVLGKIYE